MNIFINGESLVVDANGTLEAALKQFLPQSKQELSFAVALNSDFVSKSEYASTSLKEGDAIDVLFPIYGG